MKVYLFKHSDSELCAYLEERPHDDDIFIGTIEAEISDEPISNFVGPYIEIGETFSCNGIDSFLKRIS